MARNSRNKKKKTAVVFDEAARVNYLLGFHKRKEERKKVAKKELDEKIRQERIHQRELKRLALDEERKKAGLLPVEEEVNKTIRQIETTNHTITISDMPDFNQKKFQKITEDSDDEEEENVDSDINKKKKEAELRKKKELAKISEKLTKLEKQKRELEKSDSGNSSKKALKKKINTHCVKATKKFNIKDKKIKKKASIKKQKKMHKLGITK